ncbi:MAG TPA: hypothetical protein VFY29_15085 [Terriglobia bacterium]|nr:hypothetical protein [Terriglobia bacterium]
MEKRAMGIVELMARTFAGKPHDDDYDQKQDPDQQNNTGQWDFKSLPRRTVLDVLNERH